MKQEHSAVRQGISSIHGGEEGQWIDELVDWQLQQGIRRGEYKPQPKPPAPVAARSVSYSVVAAQPRNRFGWFVNVRDTLTGRR